MRGSAMPTEGGFTLVELLAVLAVIGMAGAAVALTLPGDEAMLVREAERFGARLVRAQEEAILGTRAIEVTATGDGYGFARQQFGRWEPLTERPFGNVLWEEGTRAQLPRGRAQATFRFDPVGLASAQSLVLARDDATMRVSVDSAGKVTVDAPR
ncbi:MAG TPA: GspH/FimT family pseudopilin [Pseudoxanthomonas sp.]|nr:GspH/FimT family pseudopilin [Pseudoxanthomonas sp.]